MISGRLTVPVTECDIMELYHIAQVMMKKVHVREDALDLYAKDPFWSGETKEQQVIGIALLEAVKGKDCVVLGIQHFNSRLFYTLPVSPPKALPGPDGQPIIVNQTFFPADYTVVLDHGYMEAK
jgi:hypothetical protein